MKQIIFFCFFLFIEFLSSSSAEQPVIEEIFELSRRENCHDTTDSRCLNCTTGIDCSSGSPIFLHCDSEGSLICGEGVEVEVFCAVSNNENNAVCACKDSDNAFLANGFYDDPYSTEGAYVNCSLGVPSYHTCPDDQIYEEGLECFEIPECTAAGNFEIPYKCNGYIACTLVGPGQLERQIIDCPPEQNLFNSASGECINPEDDAICTIATPFIVSPYACNVFHICEAGMIADTRCCDPEDVFVGTECIIGRCESDGLCVQQYYQSQYSDFCTSVNQSYETSLSSSEYYFNCVEDGSGGYAPELTQCPDGELYDAVQDRCV